MNRATPPQSTEDASEDSFVAAIAAACNRPDVQSSGWQIMPASDRTSPWIRVCNAHSAPPDQGWKLHVSASLASASDVLERVLPVLLAETAPFKVLASKSTLVKLNNGFLGASQVGKFITIYPNDDDQAVQLAVALDAATRGLTGPVVPSDRPLAPGSRVHYRYGGFSDRQIQMPLGTILPAISGPDGALVPDERLTVFCPPDWVTDPFEAAGIVTEPPERSPLIADRYLVLTSLSSSLRHTLYLAVDIAEPGSCVLKHARKGAGVDRFGRDAVESLRHEAVVLARLAPDPRFPRLKELVEDGDGLYLAMGEMQGEMLAHHVADRSKRGKTVSAKQVVAWGLALAAILETIHASGFVYRDLKSSNVIVAPDGQLHLIDFELAHDVGMPTQTYGFGTRGYMSPQQAENLRPSASDDVYGLGALLYFVACGAEPSLAPRADALLDRPIKLLNPTIGPELEDVIGRCLSPQPADRFPDAAAVQAALQAVTVASASPPPFGGEVPLESDAELRHRYRTMARRLGDTLCAEAKPPSKGCGWTWLSTHDRTDGIRSRDINTGCGGTLLALAEIVAQFGDDEHARVLAGGARWLIDAPRPDGPPLPGLYVGEAGIGTALLRAGQVLNDDTLIDAAVQRGRMVASLPFASPDLFNGTAGRLRFHLFLWDQTGDPDHLNAARMAGETLIASAEQDRTGACRWTIPDGYAGLSGHAYLGYAHGAAGIADTLFDLFEATGDEHFLEPARAAAQWLAPQAVSSLDDGSGLNWPDVEGAAPEVAFWCHGATGIGRFFLHLAELGTFPNAQNLAERAARMVARGTRHAGPTQCHGLAGNIEFLLDLYQATGDRAYLAEARSLARLLEAFAMERDGLLVWPSEQPTVVTPDYMVGYAGVAACLLRLSDPERRPHQLSRRGFQYRATRTPARPAV